MNANTRLATAITYTGAKLSSLHPLFPLSKSQTLVDDATNLLLKASVELVGGHPIQARKYAAAFLEAQMAEDLLEQERAYLA